MSETKEVSGVSSGYNSEKMMGTTPSRSSQSNDTESVTKSMPPDLQRKLKSRHLQMIAIGEWGKIWHIPSTQAYSR